MKFHLNKRKHFSTVRVVKPLNQLSKQQAALVDPALSWEAVGLDNVQTPFQPLVFHGSSSRKRQKENYYI